MTVAEKLPWEINAEKARGYRDVSMAEVEKYFPCPEGFVSKHLDALPDPLPLNVTGLPKEYLNPFDYTIIETDPIVLLEEIATKQYTALQVAAAYMRASVLGQRVINHVTEFLPKMAFEQATYLDKYLEENGKTVGPFHGLPVSLKDHIALKGFRNNFAFTALIDNVTDHTSLIATILKDAGAVFYQRTTQPQFLMHLEGASNMYGITKNPFNTTLTSGGSSGGEGASLGFHSSCLGVGTDIGGSVRGPASMQGVFGFRPTVGRLPVSDLYGPGGGSEAIAGTIGPMGRTLGISELLVKTAIDSKPWKLRRELHSTPWEPEKALKDVKTIRIGVLSSDGVVNPQPPVARALEEVAEALKKAGSIDGIAFEVVPFTPYKHDDAWKIISSLYFEDGGKFKLSILEETQEPVMELSKFIMTENPNVRPLAIADLLALNVEKQVYRSEYNEHWAKSGIDVLVCPAGPGAAQPHATTKYWGYTSQWNLLDYPGITFPVTYVDQEKDKPFTDYTPLNETDEMYFKRYSPEVYKDAPIALQLVTPRNEDELLIETMKLVEKALST